MAKLSHDFSTAPGSATATGQSYWGGGGGDSGAGAASLLPRPAHLNPALLGPTEMSTDASRV